jgi:hypothetical protein
MPSPSRSSPTSSVLRGGALSVWEMKANVQEFRRARARREGPPCAGICHTPLTVSRCRLCPATFPYPEASSS